MLLGLFGFLHGGSEWLDLIAMVVGDSPLYAVARLLVMTASFMLLMEFARREAKRFGLKVPGPWLYVPLAALVIASGMIGGLNAAGAVARYVFGFFGAMATSLVFLQLARAFSGFTKRLAMCASGGFAAYAIAAGAIVPVANVWPATVINYTWFDNLTGIPIQLVRGVLACWLAFSIWSIWGQHLITDVSSARYTQFLRRQFVWTLVAMATILLAGWTLTELLGQVYKQTVQREVDGNIDLLASRLGGETASVEGMVKALAGSPSILPLLAGGTSREIEAARAVLKLDVGASAAAAGYILDREGGIIAASDGRAPIEVDAAAFRSTPDFRKSIAGEAGFRFAFDPQTDRPAYYASYPIRTQGGSIAGVAVLKKNLDAFSADLSHFDHPYFLVDANGVVMLTNQPNMLLRSLWPLSAEQSKRSARQYGKLINRSAVQNEIADATWLKFNGERDFARRRQVGHGDWSLVMLKPIQEIYASRVLGIVITLLVAVMTLIYLFGKERWFHAYSALMPASRMTLPHFAVSAAMSLPKSAGEPASNMPPISAIRALMVASASPALID